MCEPTTLAIASVVASAGMAVYSGREQAKAIQQQMHAQQQQINDSAQQATNDRMAEGRRLRATARAAAAEAAVSGGSLFAIESNIEAQTGRDVSLVERNRQNGVASTITESNARLRTNRAEAVSGVVGAAVTGAQHAYTNYTIKKYGGT